MRGDCQALTKTLARSSEYCITGLDDVMTDEPDQHLLDRQITRFKNMAKTPRRGASHQDSNAPAHFVPLAVIIDEYDGVLGQYISATGADDVVVTMPVTVDVAREGKQKFFVAVAVTTAFDGPEALSDEIERTAPKGHRPVFAWVPANLFGCNDFGIFIDEVPIGEVLKNSLVNEVIEQAAIEATVVALGK
jgi:hypothetical protein